MTEVVFLMLVVVVAVVTTYGFSPLDARELARRDGYETAPAPRREGHRGRTVTASRNS